MSHSPAHVLLADLRGSGIEVAVEDGQLRFRSSPAVPPELRARMAALKRELIALLNPPEPSMPAFAAGDGARPVPDRCQQCREPDFVRPCAGGVWRCARCRPYDLPATEIEWWPRIGLTAPLEASSTQASALCYACGATARWRPRSGGPWSCSRCHSVLPAASMIETAEVAP